MFKYLKLVPLAVMALSAQSIVAQELPVCNSVAADPDGDGFGWENSASCVITSDSAGPPEFINQETGAAVNLTRAYWNGLIDFDTQVQCTRTSYTGTFYTGGRSNVLTFSPLEATAPFNGRVTYNRGETDWTVDNGIYVGPTQLGKSPWVQIVDHAGGSMNAVRSWSSSFSFHLCTAYPDESQSFVPTGSPPQTVTDNTDNGNGNGNSNVPGSGNGPGNGMGPGGGTGVGFTSICVDTDPVGDGWGWDGVSSCQVEATSTITDNTSNACIDTDPVGDGWGWDGVSSCQVGSTSVISNDTSDACVDTDPLGNGWGWNGVSSCRVGSTSVSTDTGADSCIDTDPVGDGWGWNGVASCQVGSNTNGNSSANNGPECIDTAPVGDGWGWDGSASCRVEASGDNSVAPCIDTPPLGNGWGWDGTGSCMIE